MVSYSTVGDSLKRSDSGIPTSCHVFEKTLLMNEQEKRNWLNESFRIEDDEKIRKALTRTVFKLPQISKEQRVLW